MYIFCQIFSYSNGFSPTTSSRKPEEIACDCGASIAACATGGDESTSPIPVIPASVSTLTRIASCVPSARVVICGNDTYTTRTSVIFITSLLELSEPERENKPRRHEEQEKERKVLDALSFFPSSSCPSCFRGSTGLSKVEWQCEGWGRLVVFAARHGGASLQPADHFNES